MLHDVAVEHPIAGIVRDECDPHPLARADQHGVPPYVMRLRFAVAVEHPEAVAVQMHRVPPRGVIAHVENARPAARDLGVLVSMAGRVWQPLGMTKAGHGLVGTAVGSIRDGSFVPDAVKRRPLLGALTAAAAPRVDIVAAYAGSDALAMDAFAAAGAGGIVLESLGSGNAGSKVLAGVQRLCADGIAVAVATRVPGTRVTSGYGPGRALLDAGAVSAGGLRAAQARVLLMAALASGTPAAELFAEWA